MALKLADLDCDDERVLDLLEKDGYLVLQDDEYYVTEKGQKNGLDPDDEDNDSDEEE